MPWIGGRRSAFLAAAIALLPGAASSHAAGLERLQRKFDLERGLPFSEVNSIAQDTRGFLWITAGGGLFRYDGVALQAWAREPVRRYLKSVSTGPAGAVLVREGPGDSGALFEVVGEGVRPVGGPDAAPLVISGSPVWDRQNALWVLAGNRIQARSPAGDWSELTPSSYGADRPRLLRLSEDGAPVVCTDRGIWRVEAAGGGARLAPIGGVQNVLVRADGSLVALTFGAGGSRVLEIAGGTPHELFRLAARPIDMVRRGRTLWVAFDSGLAALRPGEPPEVLGASDGVPSGGPLLVDVEGSLWLASFRGLVQYPAPDTAAWLADHATRRVAPGAEGIWVDSWSGLSLLRRRGDSWEPENMPWTGTSAVCEGGDGRVWAGYAGRIVERRDGRFVVHAVPGLIGVDHCASGAEGRVWFSTNLGLMSSPALKHDGPRGGGGDVRRALLEDASGRLWVAIGEDICHADARAVASGGTVAWSCATASGAGAITSLAEVEPGRMWAASLQAGVFRLTADDRWEPVPGSQALPTPAIRTLRPSPTGGVWIVSFGTVVRAVERTDLTAGWKIVERPGPWHGLMISDAEDLLEEPSGDLWITTLAGVVHVPAEVRNAVPPVPRIELVDVLLDGRPLAWHDGVSLPFRRNRIELRFAALSFRDPARLRYQVRLRPDAAWLDSARPSFQFVDLPPGRYRPEARVSLDGLRWSEASPQLAFTVTPPFWRTWWFAVLATAAVAAGAFALYRARVAHLLALERVRTDIATDLHDDIGASLSRTAILAEVVQRDVAPLSPAAAERLDRIARSAREVVDSMTDVVWALDPDKDELGALAVRVRTFASELLPSSGVVFAMTSPEDAAVLATRIGAATRRDTYLVVKEAVTNVARHAHARHASIAIALVDGAIQATVSDDGAGFAPDRSGAAASLGGNGLRNMKARVARCGGRFRVDAAPGRGTTIVVTVPIRSRRAGSA